MKRFLPVALVVLSGCSIVKHTQVRPDWKQTDAQKVKRLVVVVQPLPDGQQKAGDAFARIARRYVNLKRKFIVKDEKISSSAPELKDLCVEGVDGVLWLKPKLVAKGSGFEAELGASLVRCSDGQTSWSAESAGSFESKDDKLIEVTANYVREYGAEVEKYVPVAMNLLRPTLDTLPDPELTDADLEEKALADE